MVTIAVTALALLLVTWAGYPLLLSLMAMARKRPASATVFEPPSVTVIVATREQPQTIRTRVYDILKSRYPAARLDVVVAVDARADYDLAEYTTHLKGRARVVRGDLPGGKAATLNAGVRASTGEILVFADSYQTFDPDAIHNLVVILADSRYGAVSGTVVQRSGDDLIDLYWKYELWIRRGQSALHSIVSTSGTLQALRRSLWRPLPAGLICDDLFATMQVAMRGYRVGFSERARAMDFRRFTRRQHFDRKVRTLTGLFQLLAWMPAVLVPWRNPIWVHFWCHKIMRFLTPYLVLLVVLGAGWAIADLPGTVVWPSVAVFAIAATSLAVAFPRRTGKVLAQLGWALMLLGVPILALWNGIQRHWEVWPHHSPEMAAKERT